MRNALSDALARSAAQPEFVFLTGDLGFMALEPLRERLGRRFINAGVSEQNMVSVAAGLARAGFRPWVYSIAPFLYARPLEQIRNDVCFHNLPVTLVGNGGGYGYGVMGASHHALEDYGILLSLPGLRVFVPAFSADIVPMAEKLRGLPHPAYLRLGRDERPSGFEAPPYAPWRKLLSGSGPVVVVVGPLVGPWLDGLSALGMERRPRLWVLSELPLEAAEPPTEFWDDLRNSDRLIVAEEHLAHGGVGEALSRLLLTEGRAPRRWTHLCSKGYPSGRYGSQTFHRAENGLGVEALLKELD